MSVSPSLAEVIAFLNGAGPINGLWFEQADDKGRQYWWREYLSVITSAASLRDEDARDAARYRWLRKATPYMFKKIQDSCVIDATDVLYFDGAKFDAAIDAALPAQSEVGGKS